MKCHSCGADNRNIAKFCNKCGHQLTQSQSKLVIMEDQGEIELGGLLAIGGFGVVFRAFHRGIDKPLVVKLSHSGVQPALHAGRMYCHSFTGPLWEIETTAEVANYVLRQEIGWLQRYRGPYIVPVIAAGELMDGVVYCVMPYIGPSAEVLQWDNKLQLTNVIRAAEALLWLEEQGAQHGDFKPGNVLVSDDGDVRLINPATRLQKTPFPAGDSGPDMGTPTYHWSSYHSRRQDVVGLATWIYLLLTGGFPGGIWHSASDAHMAPKRFFFGRHVLLPGEIGLSALFDDLIRETFSQMSSESISSVRPWVDRLHTKDAADVLTHGNGSEIHLPSGRSDICQQYATKMSVRCAMHGCGSKTPCRIGQHLINDFEWGRLRWLGGYSTVYAHQL